MEDKIWVVDDVPSRRYPIYTRGNIGEVFPVVVSPLTWPLYGSQAELGWRDAFRDFGVYLDSDFGTDPMGILGCFGGYGYLNASFIRVFAVRTPGLTVDDIDRLFFGESDAPPYAPQAGDKNLGASLRVARTLFKTLGTKSLPELEDDKVRVTKFIAGTPLLATASDDELLARVFAFKSEFRHLFDRHILTSFKATAARGLLAQICDKNLGDASLPNRLLAGIGEVESAAPSFAMWDLSRLAEGSAQFDDAFVTFLDEFGCRGPNEWEGSSETWATKPELALAAIACMRNAADTNSPRNQQHRLAAEREQAVAVARARLGRATRFQFDKALRASAVLSQGRERSKTTIVRAIHGIRIVERELARRARDRGGPAALSDMWLVTESELRSYVAAPAQYLGVIDERRAKREWLDSLVPPFVFEGSIPPPDTWERRDAPIELAKVGSSLTGIAGCPGVARGRARVVLDPLDPRGLGPGDVLVAPITDPSWTPLFVPAEAVVVDVGAEMSHAIIVARELGIPAVVSVTGATRSIPDGALIEVDGDSGVVKVLEA
ncbi:MAG TPA: PEP-utilizing enzyme [Acidimicrobiales bacterium]|jgi:pyruvate,water dikinase|nr:PEP-utilizing enzyme [Acidimicrobiales bacterium]